MQQLVIQGGAGSLEGKTAEAQHIHLSLYRIWEETFELLKKNTAEEAVIHGIRLLEDDPVFNAGTGSKLQSDGEVRMSAALMDGVKNRFSGVINVQNIRFPIEAAACFRYCGQPLQMLTSNMENSIEHLPAFPDVLHAEPGAHLFLQGTCHKTLSSVIVFLHRLLPRMN